MSQFTVANSPTAMPDDLMTERDTVLFAAEYVPMTSSAPAAFPDAATTPGSVWGALWLALTDIPAGRCRVTCIPPRGLDANASLIRAPKIVPSLKRTICRLKTAF
jgi:hypothetical protein